MICDGLDLKDDAERDAEVIKPGRSTRHIAQRIFENQAMRGGIQNIYRGLRSSTAMVSVTAKRAIIKSVEGSGKSTSAVRQALDFQLEDHIEGYHRGCGLVAPSNGHTIVATKSCDQCKEQYQAYVEWCQENRLPVNAVLLKSLSQYYRECCDKLSIPQEDRISAVQALCTHAQRPAPQRPA